MWEALEAGVGEATGRPFKVRSDRPVGGGCINESVCLEGDGLRVFVKLNREESLGMFEAEAAGLEAIRASNSLRAPRPLALGTGDGRSWLAMEYVQFIPATGDAGTRLGEGLAAMHRATADRFGWQRDNTIGATPQHNSWSGEWAAFFRDHRIGFQLRLAAARGAPTRLLDRGDRLLERMHGLFDGHSPRPSLLHGDLWGGNWGVDGSGNPVIFDPAVYYGDREADLAMTELFGGFDRHFYRAYEGAWRLDAGYTSRKRLYNLYHVLNHFNLFGGGYASHAQGLIDGLLAELA